LAALTARSFGTHRRPKIKYTLHYILFNFFIDQKHTLWILLFTCIGMISNAQHPAFSPFLQTKWNNFILRANPKCDLIFHWSVTFVLQVLANRKEITYRVKLLMGTPFHKISKIMILFLFASEKRLIYSLHILYNYIHISHRTYFLMVQMQKFTFLLDQKCALCTVRSKI
jgi:hypothetical protein